MKRHFCLVMPFHISEKRGGGAEVQMWLHAQELARRGHPVTYICQSIRPNRWGTVESNGGISIRWLKYARKLPWLSAGRYQSALRETNPDIVVERMSSCVTGILARYCRRSHIPFVWMCSDNDSANRWRHTARLLQNSTIGRLAFPLLVGDKLIQDAIRHAGIRQATIIFSQNCDQESSLRQAFDRTSFRIATGHPEPEITIDPVVRQKNRTVLWVGNLGKNKRPEEFVKLAQLFRSSSIRFLLVGDHPDQSRVDAIIANRPNNLELLGRLTYQDTLELFDSASLLVNTSVKEGFPNTFVQAWFRGVPTLSLGVDPNNVIVEFGLGIVATTTNQIANAITHLLADTGTYSRMSLKAIHYAKTYHNIRRVVDNFLSILRKEGYA